MNTKCQIAYIHATSFPSIEANTFDAIWTASALAEQVETTLFIPKLKASKVALFKYYDLSETKLKIQSMHLNLLPARVVLRSKNTYEHFLSAFLRYHPTWAGFKGKKVLYAREPRELYFWGHQRRTQAWLNNWILCYEAHDPLGIDPNKFKQENPFYLDNTPEGEERQRILQAAQQFDVLICNTRALAEDIRAWTDGKLNPHFVTLASPLSRIPERPKIESFSKKILLGYIGTIDQYRGVNILLEAMQHLPENYTLRIVGRFRKEEGVDPKWLEKCMVDSRISSKVDLNLVDSISNVAAEIDRCDIMVQPASTDELDSRYTAPLKSYGYMVRGKPIIAGDVPSHRELFQGGKTAALYALDAKSLAKCVVQLVKNPEEAERIAQGAWRQSSLYAPSRRADEILALISESING